MNNRFTKKSIARCAAHRTKPIANSNPARAGYNNTRKRSMYEYIAGGPQPKKAKPSEPKTIDEYDPRLRGPGQNRFGGHQTRAIKGFKGNTYGPAGPCRTLGADERAKVEEDLRARGIIQPAGDDCDAVLNPKRPRPR
jgi:hypothetical protein